MTRWKLGDDPLTHEHCPNLLPRAISRSDGPAPVTPVGVPVAVSNPTANLKITINPRPGEVVVHALAFSRALCRWTDDSPATWPEGHRGVHRTRVDEITCPMCRKLAG